MFVSLFFFFPLIDDCSFLFSPTAVLLFVGVRPSLPVLHSLLLLMFLSLWFVCPALYDVACSC